jgi:hypothetical protein
MRHSALIWISLFFLFGCEELETSQANNQTTSSPTPIVETDLTSHPEDAIEVFTAVALIDGPDEELWITNREDFVEEKSVELPKFKSLHIIPYTTEDTLFSAPQDWMLAIEMYHFKLFGEFKEFSGPVKVFYDHNKNIPLAEYTVSNGIPSGEIIVYTPDHNIFIQRTYLDGQWTETIKSPHAANWTFDQENSQLTITDSLIAFSYEDSTTIVSISPTIMYNASDKNTTYAIMQKKSFNNLFQINGEVFSGTLKAFTSPSSLEPDLYYELEFSNGLLHGDVKIFNDWDELELHERFVEGELDTTLFVLDYSSMGELAKPIIYLYPEKKTEVNVRLELTGRITHSYPSYNHSWNVLANPDGTLTDANDKSYYALYWEGENQSDFHIKEGFVIPGDETVAFLEQSLSTLGLNAKEANEFIIFWLPKLENNRYNLIHFSSSEYEEMAKLIVHPEPETIIRVMMVYQPLDDIISIPKQNLKELSKKRKGFTVVEWGGSLLENVDL